MEDYVKQYELSNINLNFTIDSSGTVFDGKIVETPIHSDNIKYSNFVQDFYHCEVQGKKQLNTKFTTPGFKLHEFCGTNSYNINLFLGQQIIKDTCFHCLNILRAGELIYKVVEKMPRFPGCQDLESIIEKDKCEKLELLHFIYSHLEYPKEAIINGIEGQVVLQFLVNSEGRIEETMIVSDIGFGCGKAALKAVEAMNQMEQKWEPGRHRGVPVDVIFILPVRFNLPKG